MAQTSILEKELLREAELKQIAFMILEQVMLRCFKILEHLIVHLNQVLKKKTFYFI